jgi:hypothetical protein
MELTTISRTLQPVIWLLLVMALTLILAPRLAHMLPLFHAPPAALADCLTCHGSPVR